MIKNFLYNYFGFNKQQRNGLLVLLGISLLLLLIRITYPYFIQPDKIIVQNLPLIEMKLDSTAASTEKKVYTTVEEKTSRSKKFEFDPNTVSLEQLISLGFRERSAKTFIKYRNKGFIFKQKSDLKKVYGMSDSFYAELEPYILISVKNEIQQSAPKPEPVREPILPKKSQNTKVIELNTADSTALTELNGIGPSYAKRIVKYRSMLGGFVSVEQLKEVYGFNEELFQKVKNSVTINASLIKKINLNKDDFKSINKHPYLSYEITKSLFDWRRKTSLNATNLKEILNDPALYTKLLPYLAFD